MFISQGLFQLYPYHTFELFILPLHKQVLLPAAERQGMRAFTHARECSQLADSDLDF